MADDAQPVPVRRNATPAAKVFDVRRPGRTITSATSRPVIVGHGQKVADPMVSTPPTPSRPTVAPKPPADHQRIQIQPVEPDTPSAPPLDMAAAQLATHKVSDSKPLDSTVQPVATSADSIPLQPATRETAGQQSQPLSSPSVAVSNEVPVEPSPALQTSTESDSSDKLHLNDANPSAKDVPKEDLTMGLDMHLDDEPNTGQPSKVTVSHHRQSGRLWTWLLLLIFLLVVAAAAVDILLDGGFIINKHIPHTHFF